MTVAFRVLDLHSSSYKLSSTLLENDLVYISASRYLNVWEILVTVNIVERSGPDAFVDSSHSVTAALRGFSGSEHVWLEWKALGLERLEYTCRYRCRVVWCCGERTTFPMLFLVRLKPVFVFEVLCLLHVGEHVCATPSRDGPVIVVLGYSTDAQRAVASAATAYKLSSAKMQLAIVQLRARLALNVPVGVCSQNLRDSRWYGSRWHSVFWFSSFEDENGGVGDFCKPTR
jgi:hypothetical protein